MNSTLPESVNLDFNEIIENKWITSGYPTHKHYGSIIESIIRKRGHNLSKLAKYMNISRCTLYNWFKHESLPFEIISKIGSFINYDFSNEFPEIFSSVEVKNKADDYLMQNQPVDLKDVDHWMRKYIILLEKYNESLINKEKLLSNT
jgi:lambda repressor-like predicted transcriptional regulator